MTVVEEGPPASPLEAAPVADGAAAPPEPDRVAADGGDAEPERSPVRLALAVALPTVAAGVMVGGIFEGVSPRVVACLAGVLGCGLALLASRVRSTAGTYAVIVAGLFAIAVAMVVPGGIEDVASFGKLARDAAASRGLLRPPAPWTPGWQFIVGGLMALVGFASTWVAVVVRKPALGLLCPLPLAAVAAISVPKVAQVPSGIAALALFALGTGLVSTAALVEDERERPPLSYELRRAGKGVVFVAAISVALALLAQANVLFPDPRIDPTTEPQRPRTVPLSEAEDRVLFTVRAPFKTQWRTGVLDVYVPSDGSWRTPPFASSSFRDVTRTGRLTPSDRPDELAATFTIAGLSGSVLPTLANATGVQATGPRLAYDQRAEVLRISNGQVTPGIEYVLVAPNLPRIEDLRNDNGPLPADVEEFTELPPPPPAATRLLQDATQAGADKWAQFFFLFRHTLDEVTVTGKGEPVDITTERVEEILGSRDPEANPFEVVALQAMLARWVGVPSRIGYGYDRCEDNGDVQECRPKRGALFVEVYFPSYGWFPVTGTPRKAKPTVGQSPSEQQIDPDVLPSEDIAISVFLPVVTQPASVAAQQALVVLLVAALVLALLYLGYLLFPLLHKAVVRGRRRDAAQRLGDRARLALAYAEWRDACTDFGYRHPGDTPLMFLDRFPEDDEHTELAWLVTRCLWGDRQHDITPADSAAAEELSRALRRRLAQAHPATVRAISALSRLSLRHPHAPDLDLLLRDGAGGRDQKEAHDGQPLQPA